MMIVICLESKRGCRGAVELYEVVVIVFLIAYVSLISSYILITRQSCLKAVWRIARLRVCALTERKGGGATFPRSHDCDPSFESFGE